MILKLLTYTPVKTHTMWRAYESIMQVIKNRTEKTENKIIDYYEAVNIAYTKSEYMKKYLDVIKYVKEINKIFKSIWEFTYKISGGEEERVNL
jgi:hypothetical protein